MKINLYKSLRGFRIGGFKDANGEKCSIQESSAAERPLLWLGQDTGTHHLGNCMTRMHMDQEMAKALIPLLQRFVDQGDLAPKRPPPRGKGK